MACPVAGTSIPRHLSICVHIDFTLAFPVAELAELARDREAVILKGRWPQPTV
ncbi:hypothetical protein ACFXON_23920 [Bacillus subtilis]